MKDFIDRLCVKHIPDDTIILGEDIALVTYNRNKETCSPQKPYKLTHSVIGICVKGTCSFKLNLQEHHVVCPSILTLIPEQIIDDIKYSDDFEGYAIVLSKRFVDALNLPNWQQQYISLYNSPIHPVDEEVMLNIKTFYAIVCRAANDSNNPYRLQVIENIMRVFYYSGITRIQDNINDNPAAKNSTVEHFIELVQEHYREERLIGFYADKLCITPKYLSKLVKEHTGRSAGEWIENHVILDARAMLQASDMTIQQIAVSLNFPNQSFFGKYFKRATGMSPKQYRQLK
ncbi:MAG: AraC family transcriptional regulator [Alistipes sp.]|nr:AraC family transcriptional regulator [Alistipes sp.]